MSPGERKEREAERKEKEDQRQQERERSRLEREARDVKVVQMEGSRWKWRFEEVRVSKAGLDGRGYQGGAARYGVPRQDRKKGQVRIPTRVI